MDGKRLRIENAQLTGSQGKQSNIRGVTKRRFTVQHQSDYEELRSLEWSESQLADATERTRFCCSEVLHHDCAVVQSNASNCISKVATLLVLLSGTDDTAVQLSFNCPA